MRKNRILGVVNKQGKYIMEAMETIGKTGDTYTNQDELYQACRDENWRISWEEFRKDLRHLVNIDMIHIDGRRIYTSLTWDYQVEVVTKLVDILSQNNLPTIELPDPLAAEQIVLTQEQRQAVEMALTHRISIILGGAGTGKSTLVTALSLYRPGEGGGILCAPTGKAARNLTSRTRRSACTVHGALGMRPDESFLAPISWGNMELVVVDEASMLTLEMMAGILSRIPADCRVVLIGDPNQLLSVGAGNVMNDLLELGVPRVQLETCHRQHETAKALRHNVTNFPSLRNGVDLRYDDSFQLLEVPERDIATTLRDEAVKRYRTGEQVQVLAAFNQSTKLSVQALNESIAPLVNPRTAEKLCLNAFKKPILWDGDRVIITKNNKMHNCSNGDVGTLQISSVKEDDMKYRVILDDGRRPTWEDCSGVDVMITAYALTVHKSQGSEYDTILLPMSKQMATMLTRNLFYTAISRAKAKVILIGDREAINVAMQKLANPRRSMLVQKTRIAMCTIA